MQKKDMADVEADRNFELQMSKSKKEKKLNCVILAVLGAFLLVFGVLIFLLPSSSFSEDENRVLQKFPSFSFDTLKSGEFTEGIASFYADQFPFRNEFVGLKALFELSQLKLENNKVIRGSDGYLIKRTEYDDYSTAEKNLSAIKAFTDRMTEDGIPTVTLIAPRAVDVLDSRLPDVFGSDRTDKIWDYVRESKVQTLDLISFFRGKDALGEEVWYKTDHHWTTLGAYYAYTKIAEEFGIDAFERDHYTENDVTSDFLGTTYSSGGIKWATADEITLFRYDGDGEFLTEIHDTGDVLNGFYDFGKLDVKDKYLVFLGGNYAHVSIKKDDGGEREKLLLIKDSYANSVIPFLAEHFDLEVIDLRYFRASLSELMAESGVDRVLILVNADTLATTPELNRIKR